MVNKLLAKGLRVIAANPKMTNMYEFWNTFGRPDVADRTHGKLLATDPVLAEMHSIARRTFARRIEAAKTPELIDGPHDIRKRRVA